MRYEFKLKPEALWFVCVTAAVAVLQALVEFDPSAISDWRTWAVSLGAAAVRAAAGALLAVLTRPPEA